MSSGGDSGSSQETVTTTRDPEFIEDVARRYLARAEDLSNQPINPPLPPGSERIEGFGADQTAAFDAVRGRVATGDPTINAATASLNQFLDPNAAFSPLANQLVDINRQNTIDNFNTTVAPSTATTAVQSGSFGNTGVSEIEAIQRYELGRALGETEAGVRNQFLDRSLAAQGYAPGLAESRQRDIQALLSVGNQQQGLGQAIRDVDYQNLLTERNEPYQQLNVLGSALNAARGGGGQVTSIGPGQQSNPLISGIGALGSLLGGAGQLYGAF